MIALRIARADALFASDLSVSTEPDRATVADAIRRTVRTRHIAGCVEFVAAEYGEHPETAVGRMAWALAVVDKVYPSRRR